MNRVVVACRSCRLFLASMLVVLLVLLVGLGGCATTPPEAPAAPIPQHRIEPEVWRAIDERIAAASVYAKREAEAYARVTMDEWRERVRRRIEEVFIPWYASYWTQQWISTKVAWYRLQYAEGEPTPEERLVGYLQEQFRMQVLEPVGSFVDPRAVMDEAANMYRLELKGRVEPLSFEYGIPADVFNRHLDAIPAIVVPTEAQQDASLREILQAADLSALSAYRALWTQLSETNGTSDSTLSADGLDRVARRAVTRLVGALPVRAGTAAASTLVGGFWGLIISAGSAVWSVAEHEQDRQELEAQLRENLDAALDVMWQDLVQNRRVGVTALVHILGGQIEDAVARSR